MAARKRKAETPNYETMVKDATSDLVVNITQNDIKGAKRADNDGCAAANALCRQEHFKRAKVFKTKTYVLLKDGTWRRYLTPKSLYTEIMIYDRGGRFEAGDFILKAPRGAQRLGRYKPKGPKAATGRPVKPIHIVEKVRLNAPKGRGMFEHLFA
jgi:hypothetical protein